MGRRQFRGRKPLGEPIERDLERAGLVGVADFDFRLLARFQGGHLQPQLVATGDGLAGEFQQHGRRRRSRPARRGSADRHSGPSRRSFSAVRSGRIPSSGC